MAAVHAGVADRATVRRWIDSVDRMYHLSEPEWTERLAVLTAFCEAVGDDPDHMIASARSSLDAKNDSMRALRRFVRERYAGGDAAHDAENVVRSFFIHNGARVFVRPYED